LPSATVQLSRSLDQKNNLLAGLAELHPQIIGNKFSLLRQSLKGPGQNPVQVKTATRFSCLQSGTLYPLLFFRLTALVVPSGAPA
jgi:hypothetical protein